MSGRRVITAIITAIVTAIITPIVTAIIVILSTVDMTPVMNNATVAAAIQPAVTAGDRDHRRDHSRYHGRYHSRDGEGFAIPGHVGAWVSTRPDGGVAPPVAGVKCSPWRPAAEITAEITPGDIATIRIDADGVIAVMHYRDCAGIRQYVWIRLETPESLAEQARRDLQQRVLSEPVIHLSPPERSIVNLTTWLAIEDPGPITVTAAVPRLSVTVRAVITATVFVIEAPGATITVECAGIGNRWSRDANGTAPADEPACGHRFTRSGAATIIASGRWSASWTSSDGSGGDLEPVSGASSTRRIDVVEIQTIGRR